MLYPLSAPGALHAEGNVTEVVATSTPISISRPSIPTSAFQTAGAPDLMQTNSMAVVRRMGLGWNLGNTLEACGDWIKGGEVRNYETAWGNPETTKEIIDAVKAAGFKSVRIPVAWSNLIGDDYTIDPRLMERVKQVVDMVLADDMIAVVNIHWDSGWWSRFPADPDESMKRYKRLWSQIAENFKNYPGTLIFESLNEEGCFNDVWNRWGGNAASKGKAFGLLNDINQNFVDLVRASGGLNAKRHLLIAGYCTDIDLTVDPDFLMPTDPAKHLIVSVHYYTPYTFTGLEKDESWGKMRTTWGTEADLAELDTNMQKLQVRFLNEGVPVIVGEYGASNKKDPESVRLYTLTVAEKAYKMGMCPMLWDAGGYLDRRKLQFFDPKILEGFQKLSGAVKMEISPQTDNRLFRK
jgi:endoglucanase